MSSLYTAEVREFFRTRDWPSGLKFDVREDMEAEIPHLNIVFYRDNWLTLTPEAQVQTTNVIKEVMNRLWQIDNIPTYVAKIEHEHAEA